MVKPAYHSRAFFLELVMNLFLFVICAAICLQLFVMAYVRSTDSRILSEASIRMQTLAEIFKYERGDEALTARRIGGVATGNEILVFYDKDWNLTSKSNAQYRLICAIRQNEGLKEAEIIALNGDNEIFSIIVMVIS